MSESTTKFQGVWPALFTPVDRHGEINEKELEKLVNLAIRQNVDGLYLLGSTGQGFLFSERQRKKVTEVTVQVVDGRLPVIIQVGAMNTEESVRLAVHAASAGADGVSSVGPIYYKASVEMAIEHYTRIAMATGLPFFPYQIGHSISPETMQKLTAVPHIQGMKLTTTNLLEISTIHNAVPGWFLFSGSDELFCHAALCGTSGAIGTSYNLLGDTCRHVRQEFLNGNVPLATEFMLLFQQFLENVIPYVWSYFRRAMLIRYDIEIGQPRPPLLSTDLPWSDKQIMGMIEELESFAREDKTLMKLKNER